jgi:Transient receptor potential (TRP) ion channel
MVSCVFELVQRDSSAEQAIAVCTLLSLLFLVSFALYKIVQTSRLSDKLFANAAYLLFKDDSMITKWGFLYSQFRARSTFFLIPMYGYLFMKSFFVSCGQNAPIVQAVGMFTIDLIFFVLLVVLRPYAFRATNGWNVAISVITLLNSTLLLLFSNIFDVPVRYLSMRNELSLTIPY